MIQLPDVLVRVNRIPACCIGIPLVLGTASGFVFRPKLSTWYDELNKPAGEPPRAAFPAVWTALYAGMGYAAHVAAYALDTSPNASVRDAAKLATTLHWCQLGLNLAWTPLFFGVKKPTWALVDIVALTGVVYKMTCLFRKIDVKTSWIYVAYSAWLTYATYLNAGVVYKNYCPRGKKGGKKTSKQDSKDEKDE